MQVCFGRFVVVYGTAEVCVEGKIRGHDHGVLQAKSRE